MDPHELEEQEYTKNFDMKLWIKLYAFIKKHKGKLIWLILFSFLIAIGDVAFPLFTRYAIDNFVEAKNISGLPVFIVTSTSALEKSFSFGSLFPGVELISFKEYSL